jgi:ribosomal protein L37E
MKNIDLIVSVLRRYDMTRHNNYKPRMYVYCLRCRENRYENEIETIDISEGDRGQDRLTFICNRCGYKQVSNVYRR